MKGLRAIRIDQGSIDCELIESIDEVIGGRVGGDWLGMAHTFLPRA
jgi:hypothetical protein